MNLNRVGVNLKKIDEYKKVIIDIVKKHLPEARIILYGSRAMQVNREGADIDVAIDNQKTVTGSTLSEILYAIEDSQIPVFVDVVDLNAVSDDMRMEITKHGIIWKD